MPKTVKPTVEIDEIDENIDAVANPTDAEKTAFLEAMHADTVKAELEQANKPKSIRELLLSELEKPIWIDFKGIPRTILVKNITLNQIKKTDVVTKKETIYPYAKAVMYEIIDGSVESKNVCFFMPQSLKTQFDKLEVFGTTKICRIVYSGKKSHPTNPTVKFHSFFVETIEQ